MRRTARKGWRQLTVLLLLALALAYLVRSLFIMQVLEASSAQMLQYYHDEVSSPQTQPPVRGTIVDANGMPLVSTVTVFKLGAYPALVTNRPLAAKLITNIIMPLRLPPGAAAHNKNALAAARRLYQQHYKQILAKFTEPWSYVCLAGDDSDTCPLRKDLTLQQANAVRNLQMPGFDLEPRSRPNYPNGSLASQVLGFVNYIYPNGQAVDTGRYGIEQAYNNVLRGVPGRVAVRQDTLGNTVRLGPGSGTASQQGAQITLWLDSYVQLMVEKVLQQTVKRTGARSGTVVIERPSDGAIIAMASVPSYDPRHWQSVLQKNPVTGYNLFLNPAVSKQYEPGSTFKAVLSAIGLDSGSFGLGTTIYDPGIIHVDGITIQNWCTNACMFGGYETLQTMLHYSSNIAATEFSKLIPNVVFYKYLDDFGFGQPTGVDLAGEIPGEVRKPTDTPPKPVWVPAYKDTTAYGQGIAVTPLQMANAYAALANGGRLMVPHVAESYTLDGKTTLIPPVVKRQVISAQTSAEAVNLLVRSVIGGEACRALVPGYDVAAKTGTTTISLTSPRTIASTLAFGPTNLPVNQQFVVLMELNSPNNPYGSETAAPAVHTILQNLFNYYHLAPDQGTVIQPTTGRCVAPLSYTLGPN